MNKADKFFLFALFTFIGACGAYGGVLIALWWNGFELAINDYMMIPVCILVVVFVTYVVNKKKKVRTNEGS